MMLTGRIYVVYCLNNVILFILMSFSSKHDHPYINKLGVKEMLLSVRLGLVNLVERLWHLPCRQLWVCDSIIEELNCVCNLQAWSSLKLTCIQSCLSPAPFVCCSTWLIILIHPLMPLWIHVAIAKDLLSSIWNKDELFYGYSNLISLYLTE